MIDSIPLNKPWSPVYNRIRSIIKSEPEYNVIPMVESELNANSTQPWIGTLCQVLVNEYSNMTSAATAAAGLGFDRMSVPKLATSRSDATMIPVALDAVYMYLMARKSTKDARGKVNYGLFKDQTLLVNLDGWHNKGAKNKTLDSTSRALIVDGHGSLRKPVTITRKGDELVVSSKHSTWSKAGDSQWIPQGPVDRSSFSKAAQFFGENTAEPDLYEKVDIAGPLSYNTAFSAFAEMIRGCAKGNMYIKWYIAAYAYMIIQGRDDGRDRIEEAIDAVTALVSEDEEFMDSYATELAKTFAANPLCVVVLMATINQSKLQLSGRILDKCKMIVEFGTQGQDIRLKPGGAQFLYIAQQFKFRWMKTDKHGTDTLPDQNAVNIVINEPLAAPVEITEDDIPRIIDFLRIVKSK